MADAEYSSLSLKIEADNSSAIKGIDSVKKALAQVSSISSSLKGLNIPSLKKKTDGIKEAMNTLNGIDVDGEKLNSTVSALGSLAGIADKLSKISGLAKFTKDLPKVAENLNSFGGVDTEAILNVKDAINSVTDSLNGEGMENSSNNLLTVSSALGTLTRALGRLSKLQNIDLSGVTNSVKDLVSSLAQVDDSAANKLFKIAVAMQTFSKMKNPATAVTSQIPTQSNNNSGVSTTPFVSNNEDSVSSNSGAGISKLASMLSQISSSASDVKEKMMNVGQSIGNAFGKVALTPVKLFSSGLLGLGKYIGGGFVSKIRGGISSVKGFLSSLDRIMMYRAIRAVIKDVAAGIQEGMQNAYMWAQLTGNQFANSMDQIATSSQYAKNALGAMGAPLFNMLAPVIDAIIDKFVTLVNVINQALSIFGGSGKWIKAIKSPTTYAAAIGATGDSAKKAKKDIDNYLASFDELHVIPQKNDSSLGRGSGSGGKDYGSMFEEADVDPGIKNFVDQIKQGIENGDWKGVGTLLGNKVNELVDSIDFAGFGKKFGYGLNGGIQTAYYFLETVNFYNIGKGIATFLNNALEQIDFTFVGRLLIRGITIGVDTLIGFLANLDYGRIGESLSNLIKGALNELTDWVRSYDWGILGGTLMQGLIDFVANIDYGGLLQSLVDLAVACGEGLIQFIAGSLGDFVGNIASMGKDALDNQDDKPIIQSLVDFIGKIFKGAIDLILDIPKWVKENIIDPFIEGFNNGWDSSAGTMPDKVHQTWSQTQDDSSVTWGSIAKDLKDKWDDLQGKCKEKFTSIKDKISDAWNNVKQNSGLNWSTISQSLRDKWSGIKENASDMFDRIKEKIGSSWESVSKYTSTTWSTIGTAVPKNLSDLKDSIFEKFNKIKENASTTWSMISSNMTNPIEFAMRTIKGIVDTVKGFFNFSISWPYIPLPHFGIRPQGWSIGDLLKGSIPSLSVNWYAQGGLPTNGELFVAREAGPEMVGNIGGRSAVANNDQIVEAISAGVRDAMREALSGSSTGGDINLTVKLDGDTVYRNIVKRNNDKVRQTGMSELLV